MARLRPVGPLPGWYPPGMANLRSQLNELLDDPERFLTDGDAALRRLAVSRLAGSTDADVVDQFCEMMAHDSDARVRAEAAECVGLSGLDRTESLLATLDDSDVTVVEAVVTALGESVDDRAVVALIDLAYNGATRMIKEAAVAALGANGHPDGLPVLLDLVGTAPPQVRRRCVAALTVFDGAEVEDALRAAARDNNPMVREAAEMVVGRPTPEWKAPETPTSGRKKSEA
jgi:HEAT repeat protein